ncbi:PREDICTED: peroxidase 57-like [Ipomoea nil]|uniref:peroxidase 57-like n=1 Tax=Ipomoea nil TaxID=35883 RepID=UPI0009011D8F|nr:PREDICTED: peroxidase 57-like [Ipomoea nil]
MAMAARFVAVVCMLSLFTPAFSFSLSGLLFGGSPDRNAEAAETTAGMRVGFYGRTCPTAEEIVKNHMVKAFHDDPGVAAAIVRLQSHDCVVAGCDGSVLLDATSGGGRVEKQAPSNGKTVRGFELIDRIKEEMEQSCPGVVSCADILTFSARDALVLSGVPEFEVPGGRRDGNVSREPDARKNLASPDFTVDQMVALFKSKGLDVEDLVALLGAHSIGVAHCSNFRYRLNTPARAKEVDGSLKVVMGTHCRNAATTIPMDSTTQYKMDSMFYKQLLQKKGLLESDERLAGDPRTLPLVEEFADDQAAWLGKFTESVIKMGKIRVLTGDEGEIRKKCRFVN